MNFFSLSIAAGLLSTGCGFVIGTQVRDRDMGINFHASQCDWSEDRFFADAMKSARDWTEPGHFGNGNRVPVDANGWPLADAETVVWHGIDKMYGTYRLEGRCASQPAISAGHGGGEFRDFSYADGKFSVDFIYSSHGRTGLLLTFENTGGGVRDVKLMRPVSPGSGLSYPLSAVFTDESKRLVEKFSAVRFMFPVDGWNGPWQIEWSERVSPTYCSFNRTNGSPFVGWAGMGMAWEYAIMFCNETGKDMWINMPIGASDGYIENLARLVRDLYTVPDGKVYWEYSNEATWDASGICSNYLRGQAVAEAAAGGPVGYDGLRDEQVLPNRYYAKRSAEMSLIWRRVWGDADMMARIRPICCGQLGYDGQVGWGLDFVHDWFGNADGQHVPDPRPVNYFFYGCGGSHYSGDDPDLTVNGATQIDAFESFEEEEACSAKMYGLTRCAYEGGVWTGRANYQLPRIEEAMIQYHRLWDKYDGGLFTYFATTGGEEDGTALGFTRNSFDLGTPKYRAADYLYDTPKGKPSAGRIAPCGIPGADFSSSSVIWEHPAPGGAEANGHVQFDEWRTFKGYLFRTKGKGSRGVRLRFQPTDGADIEIMVDGVVIARERMTGSSSARYEFTVPAGLHGVRVKKYDPGFFLLDRVLID
jgi:hypothetical protein